MRRLSFLSERAEPSLKDATPSDRDHVRMAADVAHFVASRSSANDIAAHIARKYPRGDWDFTMVGTSAEDLLSDRDADADQIDKHHEAMALIVKALGPEDASGEQFGGFGL